MRKFLTAVCGVLVTSSCAWAHGADEAEELGHHWDTAAYMGEIHFQLLVMAVVAFAAMATLKLVRTRKRRNAAR